MDELFSCRNCIHNCGQSLTIGRGAGYCLQHDSVIPEPERISCKYLHRKDLPSFVVEEGVREHAAEFTFFPRLVTLDTKEPVERIPYAEKFAWEHRQFDPLTDALARYYQSGRRWVFIKAFSGGSDGRRSLAHASLVRHYMFRCDTWTSSYRLVLGLLDEIDFQPHFSSRTLAAGNGVDFQEHQEEALWDVVFARLSALQEYGWHAGLEDLTWASDALGDSLSNLEWPGLQQELAKMREPWVNRIISHAQENGEYFSPPRPEEDEEVGRS